MHNIIVILVLFVGVIFFVKKVIAIYQEASDAYNEDAENIATKKDVGSELRHSIQPIYHRSKAQKPAVVAPKIVELAQSPQKRERYVPKFKKIESIFDKPTKPKVIKNSKTKARMGSISHSNLKKAIVLKELLDKPIALRNLQ